jgi:cysteinyl-tRNA synthetase
LSSVSGSTKLHQKLEIFTENEKRENLDHILSKQAQKEQENWPSAFVHARAIGQD